MIPPPPFRILLTGPRGIGKSTLIRRLLERLPAPLSPPHGYATHWAGPRGASPLLLTPWSAAESPSSSTPIAHPHPSGQLLFDPAAFFHRVENLLPEENVTLPVVIDELGYLELTASECPRWVETRLRHRPALLCIQQRVLTPWLTLLNAAPAAVLHVTKENRDLLPDRLLPSLLRLFSR